MPRTLTILAFGIAALSCVATSPAQDKKIAMVPVKYDGLKQEVLKHRGKVVVVDFWATNCPPCVAALPHYIELQKKYADKGLVVITISVDAPDNPKKVNRANVILNEIQSPLRNLLLDEPYEMWTSKLDFKSLPFAYVFDRRGKWVRFRAADAKDPESYDRDVQKAVEQMLNEK